MHANERTPETGVFSCKKAVEEDGRIRVLRGGAVPKYATEDGDVRSNAQRHFCNEAKRSGKENADRLRQIKKKKGREKRFSKGWFTNNHELTEETYQTSVFLYLGSPVQGELSRLAETEGLYSLRNRLHQPFRQPSAATSPYTGEASSIASEERTYSPPYGGTCAYEKRNLPERNCFPEGLHRSGKQITVIRAGRSSISQ